MSAMSEPPRDLAALSVEELRAALGQQRAINTELRTVINTQAELHQAELAARDAQIAQLRSQVAATGARIAELQSQVAVLGERVMGLERQAGRDSSNSSKPPSSDSPSTKQPRKATDRSLRGRSGAQARQAARRARRHPGPGVRPRPHDRVRPGELCWVRVRPCRGAGRWRAQAAGVGGPTAPAAPDRDRLPGPGADLSVVWDDHQRAGAGRVSGRVQYGPGVCAHAANLTCANHIPVGRAAGLLSDMLGVGCSVGLWPGCGGWPPGGLRRSWSESASCFSRQRCCTWTRPRGGLAVAWPTGTW